MISDGSRKVFKFKLVAIENVEDESKPEDNIDRVVERSRIIPTSVKLEVWKRDKAVEHFKKAGETYKAEIIKDIPKEEEVSLYFHE